MSVLLDMHIYRFVLAALFFSLLACSGPTTVQTRSLSEAPSIDASLSDWDGALTPVKDRSVSISALPTDSLLYVALLIQDRDLIRSVAEKGLIVWVDPAGKQRHTYGIRYPYGRRAQRPQEGSPDASTSSVQSSALGEVLSSDVGILRNDTLRSRRPPHFSSGLRLEASLDSGSLIYELALPVDRSSEGGQLGLREPLGTAVGIGLQTPEAGDEPGLSDPSGSVPSVTGPGRRGRSPRGRRGRRQRPVPEVQDSRTTLDLWTRVLSPGGS